MQVALYRIDKCYGDSKFIRIHTTQPPLNLSNMNENKNKIYFGKWFTLKVCIKNCIYSARCHNCWIGFFFVCCCSSFSMITNPLLCCSCCYNSNRFGNKPTHACIAGVPSSSSSGTWFMSRWLNLKIDQREIKIGGKTYASNAYIWIIRLSVIGCPGVRQTSNSARRHTAKLRYSEGFHGI